MKNRSSFVVRFAAVVAVLLAGTVVEGCTSPRTEVIVSVDTDVTSVDEISIDVTSPTGTTRTSTATLGAGQPPLPRTLGLVWNGGELGPFVIRAAGLSGGVQVLQRVADFQFQRGRTLVLHVDLLARCTGVSCPGGQTCGDSGCRSTTIDPAELALYTPGTVTGVDGGMRGDGGCSVEICNGADDDCDGNVDEDFDFASDEANCGTCGNVCNFANGTGMCQAGDCLVTGCDTGFGDCNGRSNDGCESESATDANNCGRCGNRCRGFADMCCAGTCDNAC